MEAFEKFTGIVAPLDRTNVDTDAIIPKQFLKRVRKTGFGAYLFFEWRFDEEGEPKPDFVLNREPYDRASILLSGENFGCGSSREHAPWALKDFGFKTIIAPSFADIFYNNCFKNGLLPIELAPNEVKQLFTLTDEHPGYRLAVDLEKQQLRDEHGLIIDFDVDPERKRRLLQGLDEIDLTLKLEEKIAAYENSKRAPDPIRS